MPRKKTNSAGEDGEGTDKTEVSVEETMGKYAKMFDQKIENFSKQFDQKIENISKQFDEKLTIIIEQFGEKMVFISKQLDEKLSAMAKQFDEKLDAIIRSVEFTNTSVEEVKRMHENYTRKTDDRIAELESVVAEQKKKIESLLTAEKSRDLRDRANNVVIYGVPNIEGRGLTPPEWLEATRKTIENHLGIELPRNSIKNLLRLESKSGPGNRSRTQAAPVKVYFLTAMGKAAFYHEYLYKREELTTRGCRMRNDYDLQTRKFRTAVNTTRQQLFALNYRVRFVGAGDVLEITSPDGRKKVDIKSVEDLNEFVVNGKIPVSKAIVKENGGREYQSNQINM